jgi:hypothetical protein
MQICLKCELSLEGRDCPCTHPEVPHTCTQISYRGGKRHEEREVPCVCDTGHASICCDCYELAMGWGK